MDSLSDLSLVMVVAAALEEARHATGDAPPPHLLELRRRATEEVLDLALRSTASDDPDECALGISILRELGPADETGRRPFSDQVVTHLLGLLDPARDPGTERSLLKALAFNGAREALDQFLGRVEHPDDGVRVTVGSQLPSLTDPDHPSTEVLDALERLTHDADPDVRCFALYALTEETPTAGRACRTRR